MEKPKRRAYRALSLGVVAVAKEGEINDWAAYIGKTEGNNHYKESFQVEKHGTKIPYKVARILFPEFDQNLRWRK